MCDNFLFVGVFVYWVYEHVCGVRMCMGMRVEVRGQHQMSF